MNALKSKPMLPKYKPQPSGTQISTMQNTDPSPSAACKKGSAIDPITIETTSMGITDLWFPTHTNPTSQMTTTFQYANTALRETTEEFHTANDELPPGNPCASSTRRNEALNHGTSDESIKSTRGSSLAPCPSRGNPHIPRTTEIHKSNI